MDYKGVQGFFHETLPVLIKELGLYNKRPPKKSMFVLNSGKQTMVSRTKLQKVLGIST